MQLATIQKLARYWATDYDWRKVEARLNSQPNFITEIDGLDIHFIHVRSKHENALPLIVTHGWPGSIVEQLKIIDLLTQHHQGHAPLSGICIWMPFVITVQCFISLSVLSRRPWV